jgi:hypothetical protein
MPTADQHKRARQILASGNVQRDKFGIIPTGDPRAGYEAKESTIYYTGPEKSPSVTYKDPATGQSYTDYTKPIGPAASGLPDYVPGVAFGFRNFPQRGKETLGGYYLVTPKGGPNAGQSFILPHSDKGPGAGTGEKFDYNAPASMMVYGPKHWKDPPGGSHVQYIGKNLPEDVGIGPVPAGVEKRFGLSPTHSQFIEERRLLSQGPGFRGGRQVAEEQAIMKKMEAPEKTAAADNAQFASREAEEAEFGQTLRNIQAGVRPQQFEKFLATSPRSSNIEDVRKSGVNYSGYIAELKERGGGTEAAKELQTKYGIPAFEKGKFQEEFTKRMNEPVEPSFGVDWEKSISSSMRASGRELDSAGPTVNGKGKLDVDVNAPKNVSVKAEGEGLFNKTETNRQMEPMAEE